MPEAQLGTKKLEILNHATELFMLNGYPASTMRDLARSVGLEAASIYSHFSSKEEILQLICFRMANAFFEAVKPIQELELNPEEKLELVIQAHIGVLTRDPKASSVFQNDWNHMSEPRLSEFKALRDEYEEQIASIIRQGVNKGEFIVEDEKFVLLTLLAALNWTAKWYRQDGKFSPLQISKKLSAIIFKGIKNPKS